MSVQVGWVSRDIFLASLLSALVSPSVRFSKGRYFCLVLGAMVGAAATSAQPQADLSPVHLDLLPTRVQTGRWVWMGDSFTAPSRARVPFASLLTWPLNRLGAVATGSLARMSRLVPGPLGREISDDDAFVLAPGTPLESTMGLPVYRLVEWDLPVGVTDLGDLDVFPTELSDGRVADHGGLFGGNMTIRPILYAQPGAEARGTVRMAEIGSADTPIPLDGFALGPPAAVRSDRRRSVTVTADLTAPGFVHLAGMVLSGAPGHYAQFLADRRWSMSGFGDDGDPTPPDDIQRFRTADLAGYLAATTLDPAQPSVAVLHLAHELRDPEVLRLQVEAAVARVREAFSMAGLPTPVVLLLHAQAVNAPTVNTVEENEADGIVMRAVALADPGVAFISLYDVTDGVVFDGRPEAQEWLVANGYSELTYGTHRVGQDGPVRLLTDHRANLLDENSLHPTEAGAAFFAYLLGQVVTEYAVSGHVGIEAAPSARVAPLVPNPARPGARVRGADAGAPIVDLLGRHLGVVADDGSFAAPRTGGVYLVGRTRLVVQ